MTVLHLPAFGAGIVLEGSSDAQRTDELRRCDAYDIGARGQLVAASALANFASLTGIHATDRLYGLHHMAGVPAPRIIALGTVGADMAFQTINPDTGALDIGDLLLGLASSEGAIVTFASFPALVGGNQTGLVLVNIGRRQPYAPVDEPGLYVVLFNPHLSTYELAPILNYDALGTGANGEVAGGTNGTQLKPRGIAAYNNHAFAFGFDDADATFKDGPSRLMFSNLGNPLKWGLDPDEESIVDRAFDDSDAIQIGESIRAIYAWRGRLWVGTNKELHYVEGYGRQSFKTNGAVGIRKSLNVAGPHCLIEGPDGFLYGVSTAGLWRSDGSSTEHLYRRLVRFDRRSPGYWDLIWTDTSRGFAYPGQTNQDLVWMLSDPETMQVWVVIPWCDATAGYGYGTDTVIIRYNVETGGFTRQVFTGVQLTAGCVLEREAAAPAQLVVGKSTVTANQVQRYGFQTPVADAPMPSPLPVVEFGEYAPFGPNGVGGVDRIYLTFAWPAASSLPLVFTITPTVDGQTMGSNTLTIGPAAPGAPANGDTWVDTSGTDTNLGNGTAGSIVPANAADYLVKVWVATWAKWVVKGGGQQGTRDTIPVAIDARRGTRLRVLLTCTSAAGRYQLEGAAQIPNPVREDA